jgi:amidase
MTYYSYTGQFNLLNYSAGVVPHSTVLPTDVYPADYAPTNADENVIKGIWDPAKWEGAPVVVQVVCRTLEEEKCLATMKIVDEAIRG